MYNPNSLYVYNLNNADYGKAVYGSLDKIPSKLYEFNKMKRIEKLYKKYTQKCLVEQLALTLAKLAIHNSMPTGMSAI